MDIYQRIKSLNLPLGKYVVGGGAALEAFGIRKATDIDVAVTRDTYQKLRSDGWREKTVNGGNKGLVRREIDLAVGFACGKRKIRTATLLKTATVVNGVPFIDLKQIIKIKKAANRPKDKSDLRLIEKFLQSK